ncbi:phosphoribosylanthranilate isomerase [Edaphobacter aggregans]|uniref:phosphoribosylanthranilate isomerase n=1 Tax=Edaphobacter aggregans TaxID=570835 RepID=UPI00054D54E9|nr:phosphoribosylanthranilate isomerase [Edaphobacter aggregans]
MWIKICGNTNLEDVQLAVELGADALGFVFAESRRQVTAEQVARISPHLPSNVERVGVFDSRDAEEIAGIVREAGLTAVQLHSGLDLGLAGRLRELLGDGTGLIQTLHWTVGADNGDPLGFGLRRIASAGLMDRVLIDSRVGVAGGGTGVAFDWRAARAVLVENAGDLRVIAAGGLRPENVAEAIRKLRPWGVDVVSGVETAPGRKDPERLAAFLRIARSQP